MSQIQLFIYTLIPYTAVTGHVYLLKAGYIFCIAFICKSYKDEAVPTLVEMTTTPQSINTLFKKVFC